MQSNKVQKQSQKASKKAKSRNKEIKINHKTNISTLRLLAYSAGSMGLNVLNLFIMTKFLRFCDNGENSTPFLPLSLATFAISAGRFFDMFSDPLIGEISDRYHNKIGRRKLWMIVAFPLIISSFFLIWQIPSLTENFSSNLRFWLMFLVINIYFSSYTMFAIPYDAWMAELSKDKQIRIKTSKYKTIFAIIGIALCAPAIAKTKQTAGALLAIIISTPALLIAILGIKEKPFQKEFQTKLFFLIKKSFSHLKDSFSSILSSPIFILFCLMVLFLEAGGNAFMKNIDFLIPTLTKNKNINPENFYLVMLLTFILSTVFGLQFWNQLCKKKDKIIITGFALLWMGASVPLMFFLGKVYPSNVYLETAVWFALCGFGYTAASTLTMALVADFSDQHFHNHQEQREGRHYGFFAFIRKFGAIVGINIFTISMKFLKDNNISSPNLHIGFFLGLLFLIAFLISTKVKIKD